MKTPIAHKTNTVQGQDALPDVIKLSTRPTLPYDKLSLYRIRNGWLLASKQNGFIDADNLRTFFAFESTKSMCEQLPDIIGKSGWRILAELPKRDAKGHFLTNKP